MASINEDIAQPREAPEHGSCGGTDGATGALHLDAVHAVLATLDLFGSVIAAEAGALGGFH